jgi:Rrf2 family protein
MNIPAGCDYACRALLELSLHWPKEEPLQIHFISQKQDIPIKYLVQILIQLKRQSWVTSSRGKEGGYNLAKAPKKITLGEVIRYTSGQLIQAANSVSKNNRVFSAIWKEADDAMAAVLDKVTFEDIASRAKKAKESIVYQI